jgi:hypothetical protein
VRTLALLEEHRSDDELAASDEYDRLRSDLAELDRELSDAVEDLNAEDVGAVLRAESGE